MENLKPNIWKNCKTAIKFVFANNFYRQNIGLKVFNKIS